MMQHPFDDIESLALGDLDSGTARRIMDHADACPTCAVLVSQAFGAVAALGAAATREVSNGLGRRVAGISSRAGIPSRDVRATVPRRFGSFAWVGALAAALIAMTVWNVQLRTNAPVVPVDALVHSHFLHHALHGTAGNAKVIIANDGSWVYLVADDLAARGRYDLWQRRGALMARLGSVTADSSGRVTQFWGQAPGAENGFELTQAGANPLRDAAALRWP